MLWGKKRIFPGEFQSRNEIKNTLKTVRLSNGNVSVFAKAEKVVSEYFNRRHDDPEHGTIEIFGERYVLMRAASLSVEFFSLVRDLYGPGKEEQADDFSKNLLFDLAHALGRSDAGEFHKRMNLKDPVERLAAGPVHFSHTGWAFVDILPESRPTPDENYYLIYDHPYSFEANAWIEHRSKVDFPVCIMNSGYSSGWCQESFGIRLVASEITCRARGDDMCRFIMAPPDRIEGFLEQYMKRSPHLARRLSRQKIPDFFSRKRMEEELRRARDELEERVAERTVELERSNGLLRQEMAARTQAENLLLQTAKLEAVGRLAGGIAHDFNNLMGVVIGHVCLLEKRFMDDERVITHLARIREAGEEASNLTQQLLSFSRAQMPKLEHVDLNMVIVETAQMLERLIGENIVLDIALSDDAGAVYADAGQLKQIVMNLVVNARDAMTGGGTLRIETRRSKIDGKNPGSEEDAPAGDWFLLCVSDTGTGMSDETLKKAFEPFFTTKEHGLGTGLGLPTVQSIVAQCGGSVYVSTALSKGTTFRIYLPRAEKPHKEKMSAQDREPAQGAGETVLVVEDQSALRRIVVEILEDSGYKVIVSPDPESALASAASCKSEIQLLLTDVAMPKMNGRELADKLVKERPGMKVLYMSGYAEDDVLKYGVAHGKADLIAKPFTSQALARRVRQVLDK